ncbi:hypothetical protein GUITHDRAFT_154428 [Guillardia theta CCMP2712]|uniref:Uncharacterized protein n=1 Tax=Guillardia theta (strain CCMP2712) TaxID=905079 RepID=L1IUG7_GUITC|nr:hypothetical protein GUITHDRAFT_154428 [Guillardia theta CCMP2712]EKX39485.1 hypothetical protein GUITHDRAFT_154428 [Guillardia theta CCMP2712]|eukprot:XP_005826465.1 hypothetical protein GUITHDRAFT_154428 [Guillardia theta CCMP2712]
MAMVAMIFAVASYGRSTRPMERIAGYARAHSPRNVGILRGQRLAAAAPLPPFLPPYASVGPVVMTPSVVPGTAVVVPICDDFGCYSLDACVDRYDFRSRYGGCEVYADWTKRMGYCDDDVDAFGVPASQACPVSCDTCSIGMCFEYTTNEIRSCSGMYGQDA